MPSEAMLDLAIIGGGIAGVIHLHYARKAGLQVQLLEGRGALGGLWRTLPAWQDIQICPADWTVGDIPIGGPAQPDILANIEAWVRAFGLGPDIRLDTPVRLARHDGTCWELTTPQGTVRAMHLVAATGAHNRPIVPSVHRRSATLTEWHSSALRSPTDLAGRAVVVVGGGASSFDLLDLCIEHGTRRVLWIHRGVRWFTPTSKPKAVAGSIRPLAKLQASGLDIEQQNAMINADLEARYAKFGLQAIRPARPLDLRTDQLVPGRARMLAHLRDIDRLHGTVAAIEGSEVVLADGRRLSADVVLWGTGYSTDLGYFADPRIAGIANMAELVRRCACVFRSVDAPNLYFPDVGLEGVGATSWAFALGARTIMSHIRGTARLDMQPTPYRLNHLDFARHLVERDPAAGGHAWRDLRAMAMTTADDAPYPMP
jgi:glycine/D-amino acid oxidase-like deaminating enzyme